MLFCFAGKPRRSVVLRAKYLSARLAYEKMRRIWASSEGRFIFARISGWMCWIGNRDKRVFCL